MSVFELKYPELERAKGTFGTAKGRTSSMISKVGVQNTQLLFEDSAVVREVRKQLANLVNTLSKQVENIALIDTTTRRILDLTESAENKACGVIPIPSVLNIGASIVEGFLGIGATAAGSYGNYLKIGNIVGAKNAKVSWWKNALHGNPGRISTASNPVSRFFNNLKNKTSPFNLKNTFSNFGKSLVGANGALKAVASWGGVALTGVFSFLDNKNEQALSGGAMSTGRVVAETVVETAVTTGMTLAAGALIGAGIAAIAPVAAPAIVVGVLAGAAVMGINAFAKAVSGKAVTEWVSDGVCEMGKAVGNGVKAVAGWFGGLFGR